MTIMIWTFTAVVLASNIIGLDTLWKFTWPLKNRICQKTRKCNSLLVISFSSTHNHKVTLKKHSVATTTTTSNKSRRVVLVFWCWPLWFLVDRRPNLTTVTPDLLWILITLLWLLHPSEFGYALDVPTNYVGFCVRHFFFCLLNANVRCKKCGLKTYNDTTGVRSI